MAQAPGYPPTPVLLGLLLPLLLAGCNAARPPTPTPGRAGAPLRVVTTVLPVGLFTRAVAGTCATVEPLLPAGADLHDLPVSPQLVGRLRGADVLVLNGLGLEAALEPLVAAADRPDLRRVESAAGLAPLPGGADGHDHDHGHGARFGGRRTWMLDATWKWAPGGNNREQQLRLTLEAARVSGVAPHAGSGQRHDAVALSAVWRFDPHWEAGARIDQLRVSMPHEDHFETGRLRERAVMLAWKPSHMQSLRLQLSRQGGALGFESPARRSVALQYVVSLGAHGAHAF